MFLFLFPSGEMILESPQPPSYIAVNIANSTLWYQLNRTALNLTVSTTEESLHEKRARNAVVYIVVVLLFYSSAIIVGIIKYLQREKAEIEEEKEFQAYIHVKQDVFKFSRYYRVEQIKHQLHKINKKKENEIMHKPFNYDITDESKDESDVFPINMNTNLTNETSPALNSLKFDSFEDVTKPVEDPQKETSLSVPFESNQNGISCALHVISRSAPASIGLVTNNFL